MCTIYFGDTLDLALGLWEGSRWPPVHPIKRSTSLNIGNDKVSILINLGVLVNL